MTVAKIHFARHEHSASDARSGDDAHPNIDSSRFVARGRPSLSQGQKIDTTKVREQIDFAKLRQQANEIARRKADELTAAQEAERKRLSEKAEFDRQVSMAVEERIKQLRKQWIKAEFDRPWFRSAAILVGLLAIALAILLSRQRYQIEHNLILDTQTGKTSECSEAPPIWPERRK